MNGWNLYGKSADEFRAEGLFVSGVQIEVSNGELDFFMAVDGRGLVMQIDTKAHLMWVCRREEP